MMNRVITFRVTGRANTSVETLTERGFIFGDPLTTTTTLLDTFDGRLHRAGMQLRLIESDRIELQLSGIDTPPAHVTVVAAPRSPADLPSGPFRSRLAAVTELRALLPQIRIGARRTCGALRNDDGKVVAVAEVHDDVRVLDLAVPLDVKTSIEIHEVPGYTKQATLAVEALRRLEPAEFDTDMMTLCAAEADVDLDGFSSSPTVPLEPGMAAVDGFRLVLANLAATIEANWQGTLDRTDPVFLHELRIATRRTRTVLSAAKHVLSADVLGHTRSEFKWLAGLTSEPRDLDVYLLEWSHYTDPLGNEAARRLEPVRALLEQHCSVAHANLESALRSKRAAAVLSTWQTWLAEPVGAEDIPRRGDRPLGRVVAKRISRAHEKLLEQGRLIGPDTPAEQVHELRKDAKKLRYLLECFGSLLPESARKRYVKRLKALQDNLGAHQDACVHVDTLQDLARELSETNPSPDSPDLEMMLAVGRLTERLDQQRRAARDEFDERFADYDTPKTQHALDDVLEGING
jgi:CHAD domain-containing protein